MIDPVTIGAAVCFVGLVACYVAWTRKAEHARDLELAIRMHHSRAGKLPADQNNYELWQTVLPELKPPATLEKRP